MNEYRFWLDAGQSDPTTHTLPNLIKIHDDTLQAASEQFAKQYNLTVHSVDDDSVWFVHRKDGTVHRYLV